MIHKNNILADGRWSGPHGIGRFSTEVLQRLQNIDILSEGPKPLSFKSLFWLSYQLKKSHQYKAYFTPGFNPVIGSRIPVIVTICDLIHLHIPGKAALLKRFYYETFIKPTLQQAFKIITISEYSKKTIIEWAKVPEDKVIVASCGISENLNAEGTRHQPGYAYLLYVGNTKPHKNVPRLLEAFAKANINKEIKLILVCKPTEELMKIIRARLLQNHVVFSGMINEMQLAKYYRGATAVLFPSLYEGFGLPVLEAMSCGIPALTSNTTSLPEVAGDAAIMVNPYEVDAIANGIEQIVTDELLRQDLITKGFERVKLFSWDKTAGIIQQVLNSVGATGRSPL